MKKRKNSLLIMAIGIFLLGAAPAWGYVRSSSNFRLESDSLNLGGTELSSSDNYFISDTIDEIASGDSSSSNFNLYAGYRAMDENSIALTATDPVNLTPTIGGLNGGIANADGTWTVTTDSPSGYSLRIRAAASPAMSAIGSNIPDYTPITENIPDYEWSIGAADSEFGFSPYNANNLVQRFRNDSIDCATGSYMTDGYCWLGLSTGDLEITNSSSRTLTSGEDTKISFRGEVRSGGNQLEGDYAATVVVTAVSN